MLSYSKYLQIQQSDLTQILWMSKIHSSVAKHAGYWGVLVLNKKYKAIVRVQNFNDLTSREF